MLKALNHMTSMAQHINEMKRKHEHAVRVQEIQSQLEDYEGEDLTRLGELVLEVQIFYSMYSHFFLTLRVKCLSNSL